MNDQSPRSAVSGPSTIPDESSAPCYLVGQDPEGHWLAIERHGRGGGIFVSKDAALRYARFETSHMAGACELASGPVGLWIAPGAPDTVRRAA